MDWIKDLAYKGQIKNLIKRGIEEKVNGTVEITEKAHGWTVGIIRNGRKVFYKHYTNMPELLSMHRIDKIDCQNLVIDFLNSYCLMISTDFFKNPVDISIKL